MTPARFARLSQILDLRQLDLTVLMENVTKPHNIGAIVRTCDAVGIHRVHAVTAAGSPLAPAARFSARQQSAAGTGRYVEMETHASLEAATDALRSAGHTLITADIGEKAIDYREVDFTAPIALVLGSEGDGLSSAARAAADLTVSIPMMGAVSSLNVSVAAAVILFEAQRQRLERGFYSHPRMSDELRARLLFEWGYPRVARHYRDRGLSYPALGPEGELVRSTIANPSDQNAH